jgi:alpha-L-rhamnosidase
MGECMCLLPTPVGRNLPCGVLLTLALMWPVAKGWGTNGPVGLQVNNLNTPLGIDDPAPRFSWKLQDRGRGARQTAYQLQVASNADLLRQDKADVWDSGRIDGEQSLNVSYAGSQALAPSTRYFWRVKVWDAAGNVYPESEISWWETGLMTQEEWRAGWIGYETAEEDAVRHAPAKWITNLDSKALASKKSEERHVAYRRL